MSNNDTKIGSDYLGGGRERLVPDDLEADAAILTVADSDAFQLTRGRTKENCLTLTFEETGDKALWINKTMLSALIDQLGDDRAAWVGKQVPVEVIDAEYEGKTSRKVYVMETDAWDQAFKDAGVRRKHPKVDAEAKPSASGSKRRGRR